MGLVASTWLHSWVTVLAGALGYNDVDARYLATSLVDANLRGVDSHGVIRLPIYAQRIENGLVNPAATPRVESSAGIVRVDANGAPGQIAARAACQELVTATRPHGVAAATVRGSAHFGAAGFYARALAAAGFVALVVSNSEPIVVPLGGQEPLLGTNPLAFAAPTEGDPFSLDMATSASAMGKVLLAQARDEAIPADWGVDSAGSPTTDPHSITALLPLGGAKGYALALMVEILAGVLSGAAIGRDIGNQYVDMDRPQNIGHFMWTIDVAAFTTLAQFTARMQSLIAMVRATPPTDLTKPILLPGEPEELIHTERLRNGIPLPKDTISELTALGKRYQVPWEDTA